MNDRRNFLKMSASATALAGMAAGSFAQAQTGNAGAKQTFVLIHGAFHGGWCWKEVADSLRQQGHTVYTPTLTGAGERSHLISKAVNLDTWVLDILQMIRYEQLSNVVLVGHSFAGLTLCGVADKARDKIGRLVFLDSLLVEPGQSAFDARPQADVDKAIQVANQTSGGVSVPPPPLNVFGVSDKKVIDWATPLLTPHPLGAYQTKLTLANPMGNGLPASYIVCSDPIFGPLEPSRQIARNMKWTMREIKTGHEAMLTAPQELAKMLAA